MLSIKERYAVRRKVRRKKNKIKHKIVYGMIITLSLLALIVYVYTSSSSSSSSISNHHHISTRKLLEKEGYPPDALDHKARRNGGWVLYFIGMCYTFIGIALICDEWFVPAIECIVEKLEMTPDTAGATWMAAGGSAPELFTSFIGTFISRSNVGFGTIVGSAVFNVLFVIGCCAIFTPGHLPLTWWPFARDCLYYILSLLMLAIFYGVSSPDIIYWYEALILFCLYLGYVTIMFNNQRLKHWFYRRFLKKNKDQQRLSAVHKMGSRDNKTNEKEKETETEMMEQTKFDDTLANDDDDDDENDDFFSDEGPTNIHFHASLFDFLTKDVTVSEIMGVHIVSQIRGETKETFQSIDIDGNGVIDRSELKSVLEKLGGSGTVISENDMIECFNEIDSDGNGEISFKEFEHWYLKSKMRITTDIRKIFTQFDDNNDGHIDCDELKVLLEAMNVDDDSVEITDEQVTKVMSELGKQSISDRISENEFIEWYQSSSYFEKKQLKRQSTLTTVEEAEEADEGIDLSFPKGLFPRTMYIITAPIMFSLHYTLADVQKESRKQYWPWTFSGSMIWLMLYSYLMVWFATRIGQAWGVPDEVMGLTFLAAGTSVPDLLSSVIVAKMGEGDMAVSSSIGSNIFDILIGLPIPWLLFSISIGDGSIGVQSNSLFLSVVILIIMLVIVLFVIKLNKWKLTHKLGWTMFLLWILFVTQDLIRQFCKKCNP